MITTGIITEINVDDENSTLKGNLFKVEVPFFNTPINTEDSKIIITCNACLSSCYYSPYEVGDTVYLTFIDNTYSQGVILGIIYKGLQDVSKGYINTLGLKVNGSVNLPDTTSFETIKVKDLIDSLNIINNLQSSVDRLNTLITYTTSEQIIGTWIDNKTIYRRCFDIKNINATTGETKIVEDSGINGKNVIKCDGVIWSSASNNSWSLTGYHNTEDTGLIFETNGDIKFYCNKDWSSINIKLIVEYTKD